MFYVSPPFIYKWFLRDAVFRVPSEEKKIYLTFDDGPVPEATPFVLDQLKKYNAKATFFCIGKNVQENPVLYKQVLAEGHKTANHTFDHVKGWKTKTADYLANTAKCAELVDSNLFRPPYGKITFSQYSNLKLHYSIVLWDVLSWDFNIETTPEKCLQNVLKNAKPGSIIVFHDSKKAFKNMSYALPKVLEYFAERGYRFEAMN
ncbi:MAG: polysaccharide deacetylase family protein [Bacteroidia bacterium]